MTAVLEATRPVQAPAPGQVRRRARRRSRWVLLAVLAAGTAAFWVRTLLGDFTISFIDFWRILAGADLPPATFVLMESKLPRAVAAVLAGAAFGASGAAFQSMLRNPLASPDVIGISLGASATAVTAIVVLRWNGTPVIVSAVLGALLVAGVLLAVGRRGTQRMVLVGIGLAAAMQAVVHWLMVRADVPSAQDALVWLTGSLSPATWGQLRILAVLVMVCLPALVALGSSLSLLELGDDTARGLGSRPGLVRTGVTLLAVALTAACTAVVGPVAFVALLSGPIARRLHGGRVAVGTAALVGAGITLLADHAAASWLPNLPVGVVTGAAGAPFLLWLLASARHREDA